MNRTLLLSLAVVVASLAISCGTLLAAPDEDVPSDAGPPKPLDDAASDGSTNADGAGLDGSSAANAPMPPPACPLARCEDLPPTVDDTGCSDDTCSSEFDWSVTGDVQISNDTCKASDTPGTGAFTSRDRNPKGARRYAVVTLSLVSAIVQDRAIMSLHIKGQPDGERFEAVVRNGLLRLCERSGTSETCTSGVPFSQTGKIHLYGVVSTTDPPNASFALAVDTCGAPEVLPVTRPFSTSDVVEGSVGCLPGPSECVVTYSASAIYIVDQ